MFKKMMRPVSFSLIVPFLLLNLSAQTAKAQMVDTSSVIAGQRAELNRARVAAFVGREDVQQVMVRHGVDPAEAERRVASLSDAELANIANSMDQLPAGGSAVGAIVGAAVLVFFVLLITDIVGLTHVFPFVNHPRH